MEGQQAYEKVLSLTNQQGNTNQHHNTVALLAPQDGTINKIVTHIGQDMETNFSYTVGGEGKWCSLFEKQAGSSSQS